MPEIKTYSDAKTLIDELDPRRAGMLANRAYREGDHWQKAEAWGGPPIPSDMLASSETMSQMEKDQAPIPLIEEVVERHITGVVGREPAFEVVLARELKEGEDPSDQESTDLRELNDALTAFYDGRGGQDTLGEFVGNLCSGRGTLRFFIPPELSGDEPDTLLAAMGQFYLEAPDWEYSGVYTDPRSMRPVGIYLYKEEEVSNETKTYKSRAEITEVDQNGKTVFRVLEGEGAARTPSQEAGGAITDGQPYDCNGHVWIYQAIDKTPLVGVPQRKLQRAIDFLSTILPKNAQYAGFRERNYFNVERQKDPDTGEILDPVIGPTTVNFWSGTTYQDGDGKVRQSAATLNVSEPVDSSPIRDDIEFFSRMLLRSCYQEHVVISGDATVSAVSRVQARAEFVDSLLKTKPKVEKVLRDLFMTVLCLGCELSDDKARLQRLKSDYRIRVDVKPSGGPIPADEARVVIERVNAGLLSKETGLVLLGVEDVSAELNKLLNDPDSELVSETKRATLLEQYASIFDIRVAAELAGYDEEQIKIMTRGINAETEDDSDEA